MPKCLTKLLAPLLLVAVVEAADLTGGWALEFQTEGSTNIYSGECAFKQEGERLTGSCGYGQSTPVPVTGNVKGSTATFQFRTGLDAGYTISFSGQLDAQETSIKGTWSFVDQQGDKGQGTFSAVRH
jgi:hypothetical protein